MNLKSADNFWGVQNKGGETYKVYVSGGVCEERERARSERGRKLEYFNFPSAIFRNSFKNYPSF